MQQQMQKTYLEMVIGIYWKWYEQMFLDYYRFLNIK